MKRISSLEVLLLNQKQKKDKRKQKRKLGRILDKEKMLREKNGNEWKRKRENE